MAEPYKTDFDFDQEAARFFRTFPSYRARVFVPPPVKDSQTAVQTYRDFVDANGLDDFFEDEPARKLKMFLYPPYAVVFPPDDDSAGVLPRWKALTDHKALIDNLFAPGHFFSGQDWEYEDFKSGPDDLNHFNYFWFDHEIGHILTTETLLKAHKGDPDKAAHQMELAADLYGLLRHCQRFGTDTDFADLLIKTRCVDMVQTNDFIHFTAPTLRRALIVFKNTDINALSPREAVKLALNCTRRFAVRPKTAKNLKASFNDLARDLRQGHKINRPTLQRIKKIGQTTACPEVRATIAGYFDLLAARLSPKLTHKFNFAAARQKLTDPQALRPNRPAGPKDFSQKRT